MTANPNDDGWEGILDADEEIIWQGRPDATCVFPAKRLPIVIFGGIFATFALFWMLGAAQAGGFFWMFGLIHFGVGLSIILGAIFGPSFMHRRTWYTLTNRRALIAKTLPIKGRSLKSFPITADSSLELQDAKVPSLFFAQVEKRGKNGTYTVPVGFERIAEARQVMQLIRTIQKDLI